MVKFGNDWFKGITSEIWVYCQKKSKLPVSINFFLFLPSCKYYTKTM